MSKALKDLCQSCSSLIQVSALEALIRAGAPPNSPCILESQSKSSVLSISRLKRRKLSSRCHLSRLQSSCRRLMKRSKAWRNCCSKQRQSKSTSRRIFSSLRRTLSKRYTRLRWLRLKPKANPPSKAKTWLPSRREHSKRSKPNIGLRLQLWRQVSTSLRRNLAAAWVARETLSISRSCKHRSTTCSKSEITCKRRCANYAILTWSVRKEPCDSHNSASNSSLLEWMKWQSVEILKGRSWALSKQPKVILSHEIK